MVKGQIATRARILSVVFDSSVVFTKDPTYFLNKPVTAAILEAQTYSSLVVKWYIPHMVFLERLHRRRERAQRLADNIAEAAHLAGFPIDVSPEDLQKGAEATARAELDRLSVSVLTPDWSLIDWDRLTQDAAFRRPPFGPGDSEKGFRDAIVVEAYLQHVSSIARAEGRNQAILVTEDGPMAQATLARLPDQGPSYPPATFDELRSLLATILAELQEELVARLIPKATARFYTPRNHSTLYYQEAIPQQIEETLSSALSTRPPGADFRVNSPPSISGSRLKQKKEDRFFWANKIIFRSVAYRHSPPEPSSGLSPAYPEPPLFPRSEPVYTSDAVPDWPSIPIVPVSSSLFSSTGSSSGLLPPYPSSSSPLSPYTNAMPVSNGTTTFDAIWSSLVTAEEELTDVRLEGIQYVDVQWT